jgi:translation initiation factor 5A
MKLMGLRDFLILIFLKLYKWFLLFVDMVAKVIEATEMRTNTFLLLDGVAHQVKKFDISKTGKHGHAKVRFEAVNIVSGKKKVQVVPGHDRFEIPMITKNKAQVLSVQGDTATLMDSETYENLDLDIPEDLKGTVKDGIDVEYWVVEGDRMLKKVL